MRQDRMLRTPPDRSCTAFIARSPGFVRIRLVRHPPGCRYAIAALIAILASGCGTQLWIPLGHDLPTVSAKHLNDTIVVVRAANEDSDRSDAIGYMTFSLFAIPSIDVESNTPLRESVVWQVAHALQSSGYRVKVVDSASESLGHWPTLSVEVQEFRFKNYLWFAPFFTPTWGQVQLRIVVQDVDGRTILDDSFTGKATVWSSFRSCDPVCAFSRSTHTALTELLNDLAVAVTSQEFRQALAH